MTLGMWEPQPHQVTFSVVREGGVSLLDGKDGMGRFEGEGGGVEMG